MISEKKFVRMIDCTPTWEGVLPILLEGLKSSNNEVYQNNMKELRRMARLADEYTKLIKSEENESANSL